MPFDEFMTYFYAAMGILFALALVWFACTYWLSRQLRERHPEKYDDMGLADMLPHDLGEWLRGYNNAKPVGALLKFLFRREDAALDDASISRLATFMRRLFVTYLCLFALLLAAFFYEGIVVQSSNHPARDRNATASPPADPRRERAFELHRARKWAEAVAAYDELLEDSEQDAELHYWRGMASWQMMQIDAALQDFRRAVELRPAYFDACVAEDRILSARKQWDEILLVWDKYIAEVPGNGEAYFERGGANYHKGDLVAAQADAQKACDLGKKEGCAYADRLRPK